MAGSRKMTQTSIKTKERRPFITILILLIGAFQVINIVYAYGLTPEYMIPFLDSPIGRLALVSLGMWEITGFALLYIYCPRSKGLAITAVTFVAIVNAGPLTLAPWLGPGLLSSSINPKAGFGPIMGNWSGPGAR
jgi:hypothetical protein